MCEGGTGGRFVCQGFESKHNWLQTLKMKLSCIPNSSGNFRKTLQKASMTWARRAVSSACTTSPFNCQSSQNHWIVLHAHGASTTASKELTYDVLVLSQCQSPSLWAGHGCGFGEQLGKPWTKSSYQTSYERLAGPGLGHCCQDMVGCWAAGLLAWVTELT